MKTKNELKKTNAIKSKGKKLQKKKNHNQEKYKAQKSSN